VPLAVYSINIVVLPGRKRLHRSIAILIILVTGYSCSVEKNTNLSRFYHNITSQYNIYFNGYETYQAGLMRISSTNIDNYSTVMPLFEFSNKDAARVANGDMERVVLKCSKLISMHSMTAKPERKSNEELSEKEKEFQSRKDYNNWVDDSYLLMGKAQLIQQLYSEARITLLHNIRESSDKTVIDESSIWLARVSAESGNYGEASRLLNEIKTESLNDGLRADYYLTLSDIKLKEGDLAAAASPLAKSLQYIKGAKEKNRYTYILAKIYEETDNFNESEKWYREVLKLNPPYEMEFNTRINLAGVFDVETGDIESIRKELNKLLKDAKNKEYKDQIYYALGNLAMREGKIDEAIELITKSAAASTNNTIQKGRSYLMLGEHFFKINDYKRSQVYYDSAVISLSEEYPGFDEFYNRSLNLNELAGHLSTVEREDSLQYVASLPAPQREALIAGIIQIIEREERLAETQIDQRYNMGEFYETQRRFQGDIEATGKWYFYNQAALTFGRSEFRNRWGERKLEDNWRRMNKSRLASSIIGDEGDTGQVSDTSQTIVDNKSQEYYLRNLPLTDSLIVISNDRISSALFNAGRIFQERIINASQANLAYTTLIERYPNHPLIPQTLYNLYQLNRESDPATAGRHRSSLIDHYPESDYAKILVDPDYYNTMIEKSLEAESLYNRAYDAWESEDLSLAASLCEQGINLYPESELAPKFMLLRSYAIAQTVEERVLKEELNLIAKTYPGTTEAKRASELVEYLNQEIPELKIEEERVIARDLYSSEQTGEYYFVVVLKSKSLDINRLTFDVINFNIDNYTDNNFGSKGELINDQYIRITVGPIADRENAAGYFKGFIPSEVLRSTANAEIITFIITTENLAKLNSNHDPDRYLLFFRENYGDLIR
jgi:tetratricopeptide (TPR) repeat protein